MKILFVCKYNRFRSQIAESYFKKINKNKKVFVNSAGMIKGDYPLDKLQVSIGKRLGVDIGKKPEGMSINLLKEHDIIVIVADNVSTFVVPLTVNPFLITCPFIIYIFL